MNRVMWSGLGAVGLAVLMAAAPRAQAPVNVELKDAKGQSVGTAVLTSGMGGVQIQLNVKGLEPGVHAIHVHAVPKCEGPDFTSAGGHFNPANKQHGLQNPQGAHAGDMENFTVTADGTSKAKVMAKGITLGSELNSVFAGSGTALVIHAAADDMKTDPSGNAGDRVACGLITK